MCKREIEAVVITVPTFLAYTEPPAGEKPLEEFGEPHQKVIVSRADGVQMLLACSHVEQEDWPEIVVERRPGGWGIFLHPLGQRGDPSAFIYILDDGRNFIVPEFPGTTVEPMHIAKSHRDFPELDRFAVNPGRPF